MFSKIWTFGTVTLAAWNWLLRQGRVFDLHHFSNTIDPYVHV